MNLQIFRDAAWRIVIDFEPERVHEIEDAAAMLSRAAGGLSLRIVDESLDAPRNLNEWGAFRAQESEG